MAQEIKLLKGYDEIMQFLYSNGIGKNHLPEQLEFNDAFIYELPNDQILMHSNSGTEALIFDNEKLFMDALNKEEFPAPDPAGVFVEDRKYLKDPAKNLDVFLERIKRFGVIQWPTTIEHNIALEALSVGINNTGKENLSDSDLTAICVFFGELLRLEFNGKWVVYKESSLNPYYTIDIEDELGPTIYTNELLEHIWNENTVSLIEVKNKIEYKLEIRRK